MTRGPLRALMMLVGFGAGEGLLSGLKAILHRARPEIQIVAEHGYGVPSGRSFATALVYGLLAAARFVAWPAARHRAARRARRRRSAADRKRSSSRSSEGGTPPRRPDTRPRLIKVAQVALAFWVVLATAPARPRERSRR